MSVEKKENDVVEEHKKMLILSGNLSEFQLKNLKTWPFVVFDNIDNAMVDYNFGDTGRIEEAGEVTYTIMRKDCSKQEDNFETKKETIINWVKFMFWKDTKVMVKYGN